MKRQSSNKENKDPKKVKVQKNQQRNFRQIETTTARTRNIKIKKKKIV